HSLRCNPSFSSPKVLATHLPGGWELPISAFTPPTYAKNHLVSPTNLAEEGSNTPATSVAKTPAATRNAFLPQPDIPGSGSRLAASPLCSCVLRQEYHKQGSPLQRFDFLGDRLVGTYRDPVIQGSQNRRRTAARFLLLVEMMRAGPFGAAGP